MLKTTRWNIIYEVGNCFVMVDGIEASPISASRHS